MEPKQLLEQIRARVGTPVEEVTFARYLEMVEDDPRLARLSHALISDTIEASGLSVGPDGEERFAVFKLITNSNFVGCSTGRSAGLVPLRILYT